MQHLNGIFTLKLKKVMGMTAGDDASQSLACSMSYRLVRKVEISPFHLSSARFAVVFCQLTKERYLTPAYSSNVNRPSHSDQSWRYQAYEECPDKYGFPSNYTKRIDFLLLWSLPRPQGSL